MKGIILGSVTDGLQQGKRILEKKTPYGNCCYFFDDEDKSIIYVLRHGKNHQNNPRSVSYKANAEALSRFGVDEVVSLYAVGSVNKKLRPGCFALIEDFIDFSQPITFFENEVRHLDFSSPFDLSIKERLKKNLNQEVEVVYFTTFGPRLETRSEVRAIKILGADVVGMTLGKEIPLLIENGIKVASVALSVNWASGYKDKIEFLNAEEEGSLTLKVIEASKKALLS